MAISKTKPTDLPSGDDVEPTTLADELDVAYISFSATGIKIETPPELGDTIILMVHGRCTFSGDQEQKDGEIRPKRVITVTSAHHPGRRPVEDPNQGSMFTVTSDEDGTSVEPEGGDQ